MNLIYRGVAYNKPERTIEAKAEKIEGKYRGESYQIDRFQLKTYKNNAVSLKYRGVEYGSGSSALEICLQPAVIPSVSKKFIEV